MVNRAGVLLLVLLFLTINIGADSDTSSITGNGASFISSSVVQPVATWSERIRILAGVRCVIPVRIDPDTKQKICLVCHAREQETAEGLL